MEQKEFDQKWEDKIRKSEERESLQYLELLEEQEKIQKSIAKMGSYQATELEKNEVKTTLNPIAMLKPYLFPYQQYMYTAAKALRFTKHVVTWEVGASRSWHNIDIFLSRF